MYQIKTSSELKMAARGKLLGNYGKMITAFLVTGLIPNIILFIAEDLLAGPSIQNTIMYYVIYLLVMLLLGIFLLGQAKLYMNFATGRPFQISDVFSGFRGRQDLGILIMLVFIGISLLCMIPFGIAIALYLLTGSPYLYPIISLALIGGAIVAYLTLLSLSQSFYIAVDFPNYNLRQVLDMSRKVMKGQRARMFYLQVSFLPLILLCVLSFGIGLLWLYPYMNCTFTHFYLNLMDYKTQQYQ